MTKKTLAFLLALSPLIAEAQISAPRISGGGSSSASLAPGAATTCTANSLLYTDASQLLQCNPATVQNGSVTTAGRSIVKIQDTISGASATSNFLNVTGAFNATLSAQTIGAKIAITGDDDSQIQNSLNVLLSGASSGGTHSEAIYSEAQNTGQYAIGLLTASTGAATNGLGIYGYATAGTNRAGGFFTLGLNGFPTGIAALVADNGSAANDIFKAADNGTAVFTIADGGYVQGTRGEVSLNANYTNATAGFTNTALSVDVVSGRTYSFDLNLMFSDSTAADGAQFDFNGGSAAATNFDVHCTAANNVGAALAITNAASTTLATAVQVALALTTQAALSCHGSFVPSGSGTFIVRGAQTAHTAGTLTINRGSSMSVRDSRPL